MLYGIVQKCLKVSHGFFSFILLMTSTRPCEIFDVIVSHRRVRNAHFPSANYKYKFKIFSLNCNFFFLFQNYARMVGKKIFYHFNNEILTIGAFLSYWEWQKSSRTIAVWTSLTDRCLRVRNHRQDDQYGQRHNHLKIIDNQNWFKKSLAIK